MSVSNFVIGQKLKDGQKIFPQIATLIMLIVVNSG